MTSVFVVTLALLLYGTFEHWAGDGSFGPRYLVPMLPLIFLAVGFAWEYRGRAFRSLATVVPATLAVRLSAGVPACRRQSSEYVPPAATRDGRRYVN